MEDPAVKLRELLAQTESEAIAAARDDKRIAEAAKHRLSEIETHLPSARKRITASDDAFEVYKSLLAERARLTRIIAVSQ